MFDFLQALWCISVIDGFDDFCLWNVHWEDIYFTELTVLVTEISLSIFVGCAPQLYFLGDTWSILGKSWIFLGLNLFWGCWAALVLRDFCIFVVIFPLKCSICIYKTSFHHPTIVCECLCYLFETDPWNHWVCWQLWGRLHTQILLSAGE